MSWEISSVKRKILNVYYVTVVEKENSIPTGRNITVQYHTAESVNDFKKRIENMIDLLVERKISEEDVLVSLASININR
jgi:hypothetical protein